MKDIILQQGDIVVDEEGEYVVDHWEGCKKAKLKPFIDGHEVLEVKRPVKYETIYKKPQDILDKEEKEWLSNFVKPFRNRINFIIKGDNGNFGQYLYI